MASREQRLEVENLELRAQVLALEGRLAVSGMVCPMCGTKVTK